MRSQGFDSGHGQTCNGTIPEELKKIAHTHTHTLGLASIPGRTERYVHNYC